MLEYGVPGDGASGVCQKRSRTNDSTDEMARGRQCLNKKHGSSLMRCTQRGQR